MSASCLCPQGVESKCPDSPATTVLDSADSDASDPGDLEDTDVLMNLLLEPSRAEGKHCGEIPLSCKSPVKRKLEPLPEGPPVDMEELLARYPLNDPNTPSLLGIHKTQRRVIVSSANSVLSSCNLQRRAQPTQPSPIMPMSLASKRQVASQMIADMPHDIQCEAESRLYYVLGNPAILLLHEKSPWRFIQNIIDLGREFYIGITERPRERFEEHSLRFSQMAVWIFEDSRYSAAAEKSLIKGFRDCSLMLNVGNGGERRSAAKPHFLYVTTKDHRRW